MVMSRFAGVADLLATNLSDMLPPKKEYLAFVLDETQKSKI